MYEDINFQFHSIKEKIYLPSVNRSYLLSLVIKWNAVSSRQRSCRYCCMDAPPGRKQNGSRRSWTAIIQECCEQYWISPGDNTPQNTNYTATYLPSRKLYKFDEPDMQDTAGEVETSSSVMYSYGPPHMAEQKQDDQLEHIYSSYVRIRDVDLKTSQRRWTIGKSVKRGSGISVLAARHDDDDDIYKSSKVDNIHC